jgi:hypothetical protein
MYGTKIEKNGQIIHRSKNLRGMLDYGRISPVSRVELTLEGEVNGKVSVIYEDGATTSAFFKSYHIAVDWIRKRRSWKNADIIFYGGNIGYLTKPGIIAGV